MPGLDPRAIAYGIFNESSLRTQGPQRERNCAHRGGADSRFCTGAQAFFSLLRPGVMGPCVRRDDPWSKSLHDSNAPSLAKTEPLRTLIAAADAGPQV